MVGSAATIVARTADATGTLDAQLAIKSPSRGNRIARTPTVSALEFAETDTATCLPHPAMWFATLRLNIV
jgi:hypothetical protein